MTTAEAGDRPAFILEPYTASRDTPANRRRRRLVWLLLLVFCFLDGFAFAFLAPNLLMFFVIPFALIGAAIVWALPETLAPPEKALLALFFAFVACLGLWPNYLAITIPGLPWITVARLIGFPLVLTFVVCISTSTRFREDLASSVSGEPLIWKGLLLFSLIQLVSIAFSNNKFFSLDRFLTAQVSWTAMTFIAAYIFAKPGMIARWTKLLWLTLIPIGLLGLWENHLHHVPWLGHIPGFLRIQDPDVVAILYGTSRAGSGAYRVQSTFTTSITLAEYIALLVPFLIYYFIGQFRVMTRIGAFLTTVFMAYIVFLTNSRSGVIGFIVSLMLYALYWGMTKWRVDRNSLIGPAIVFSYPITGAVVFAATFFVGRLHRLVWGGGQYTNSTTARADQYRMGIPKVLSHPWGYGIGEGGNALGYFLPGGRQTIDTYYLDVALDYGILGFIVFYSLLCFSIYEAARLSLISKAKDETSFVAPAGIALANFVIIKSVFSQQDNNPIAFMLVAMVLAVSTRLRVRDISPRAEPVARPGGLGRPALARHGAIPIGRSR